MATSTRTGSLKPTPDYVNTCAGVLSALARLDRAKAREISKEILKNGPMVLVDVAMKYALD